MKSSCAPNFYFLTINIFWHQSQAGCSGSSYLWCWYGTARVHQELCLYQWGFVCQPKWPGKKQVLFPSNEINENYGHWVYSSRCSAFHKVRHLVNRLKLYKTVYAISSQGKNQKVE